jgi:hypothetical protein
MDGGQRGSIMRYRVDEWVDDESRNSGKNIYTVYEIQTDGTETQVLETHDRDEVESLVDGEECEWSDE